MSPGVRMNPAEKINLGSRMNPGVRNEFWKKLKQKRNPIEEKKKT